MSGPLTVATVHGTIGLHRSPDGWHAACPACDWASPPTSLSLACLAGEAHADLAEAPGLEDHPRATVPDPRTPGITRRPTVCPSCAAGQHTTCTRRVTRHDTDPYRDRDRTWTEPCPCTHDQPGDPA